VDRLSHFHIVVRAIAWAGMLAGGAGGWLGWQLLRQNGRMLLRIEELEKRLNELEFGKADVAQGLPVGPRLLRQI
jgi:hypothetical protein